MGLQHLSDRDERQNHGSGLEVEFHHIRHDGFIVPVHLSPGHGEQHAGGIPEGGRRAQGDQGVHIRSAVEQALISADKKLLVDDHHDGGQKKLDQAHGDMIVIEEGRKRPSPHHVTHGKVHENEQKPQGGKQPFFEYRRFMIPQGFLLFLDAGAAASGGTGGSFSGSAIACVRDGTDDRFRGGSSFNPHGIGQKAHTAGGDAGDLGNGLLHPGLTGGTAHTGYCILFHIRSTPYFLIRTFRCRAFSQAYSMMPGSYAFDPGFDTDFSALGTLGIFRFTSAGAERRLLADSTWHQIISSVSEAFLQAPPACRCFHSAHPRRHSF